MKAKPFCHFQYTIRKLFPQDFVFKDIILLCISFLSSYKFPLVNLID